MLPSHYLQGIRAVPAPGLGGVYFAEDYRHRGSSRVIGSYRDLRRYKPLIFTWMREIAGQREQRGEWDVHHIVEGQHFADIDFAGRIETAYPDELPCVLIQKREHSAYNQLLHIKETDEMFRDRLPRDLLERSRRASADAAEQSKRRELHERVDRLALLYRHTYMGDGVLQHFAQRVFDQAHTQLQ